MSSVAVEAVVMLESSVTEVSLVVVWCRQRFLTGPSKRSLFMTLIQAPMNDARKRSSSLAKVCAIASRSGSYLITRSVGTIYRSFPAALYWANPLLGLYTTSHCSFKSTWKYALDKGEDGAVEFSLVVAPVAVLLLATREVALDAVEVVGVLVAVTVEYQVPAIYPILSSC